MQINNLYKKAFKHLESDPIMKYLISKLGKEVDITDRYNDNYSKAIADIIIEQQISFKAAITIKKKFNSLIKGLSDLEVINLKEKYFREIGISHRKIEYIKNVYKYFLNNKIDFKSLVNDEIIRELISIKGVGSWTAEMFMIFILFRENIFSKKDLALINSIKLNYKIKNLTDIKLNKLISSWSPYNTYASLLLWKSIEEKVFFKKN